MFWGEIMSLTDKCRPILLGEYMVSNSSTVRTTAKKFGISKSTVHKDIRDRLPDLSPELYKEVEKLLETNKRERHIRGGLATKQKYELQNKEKNKHLQKKF
jgi:putative DeoR family transcriptional regulator (stage III sporulation protein D)